MKDINGVDIKRLTIDVPILVFKKLQRLSKLGDGSLTTAVIDAINHEYEASDMKATEARESDE
jgi:hypothetical protein